MPHKRGSRRPLRLPRPKLHVPKNPLHAAPPPEPDGPVWFQAAGGADPDEACAKGWGGGGCRRAAVRGQQGGLVGGGYQITRDHALQMFGDDNLGQIPANVNQVMEYLDVTEESLPGIFAYKPLTYEKNTSGMNRLFGMIKKVKEKVMS